MSDIIHIQYEGGIESLIDVTGLFSFTLYDKYGNLDAKDNRMDSMAFCRAK